jgi:hypothetical protein
MKYMTGMKNAIQSFYPISDRDAYGLILGELADLQRASPSKFETLANQYNLTTNDVVDIIHNYKSGTVGTICP